MGPVRRHEDRQRPAPLHGKDPKSGKSAHFFIFFCHEFTDQASMNVKLNVQMVHGRIKWRNTMYKYDDYHYILF